MKNLIAAARYLLLVILMVVVLPCYAYPQDEGKVPRLALDERDFDFGRVKEGSHVSHEFTVKNQGNAVLEIEKIQPG